MDAAGNRYTVDQSKGSSLNFKCIRVITLTYLWVIWILWLLLTAYSVAFRMYLDKQLAKDAIDPLDLTYFLQIREDWQTPFLTDIVLLQANQLTSNKCPDDYPSPVIGNLWQKDFIQKCSETKDDSTCFDTQINQVRQNTDSPTILNNMAICAKRSKYSMQEVKLNTDLSGGGKCERGYISCQQSETPTPQNTICVPVGEKDQCPITTLQFISEQQIQQYQNNGFEIRKSVDNKYILAFSKESNQMPAMATRLTNTQPCLDTDQRAMLNTYFQLGYYPPSLDICLPQQNNVTFDDRFVNSGMNVSYLSLLKDNKMQANLEKLGFNAQSYLSSTENDFDLILWYRPAISWKLECDVPFFKDQTFIKDPLVAEIRQSTTDYRHLPDRNGTLEHFDQSFNRLEIREQLRIAIGLTLIFSVCSLAYITSFEVSKRWRRKETERFDCNYRWEKMIGCRGSYHLALTCLIVLAFVWLPVGFNLWNSTDFLSVDKIALDKASGWVNLCADKQTSINFETATKAQEEVTVRAMFLSIALTVLMALTVLLCIICGIYFFVKKREKENKNQDNVQLEQVVRQAADAVKI